MGGIRLRNKLSLVMLSSLLSVCFAVSGCSTGSSGSKDNEEGKPAEELKPVTITMNVRSEISENWDELIVNPLKKKYPHITVKEVKGDLNELIQRGEQVDLYTVAHVVAGRIVQMDLNYDIEPLMKKFKMDMSRFEPVVLEAVRGNSGNGQLIGLPFNLQFFAMYYNKDIFDMFGVPYPKDGLTWNETVELAKKVSRYHGGAQYLGFKTDQIHRLADPFGVTPVDAKTDKASVINESYKRAFELSKLFFSIPGNMPASPKDVNKNALDQFRKDKNLAMYYAVNRFSNLKDSDVNWDIAQSPYYPDMPNVGGIVDSFIMGITKTSQHKDDAFRVIETFLSEQAQLFAVRSMGYISPQVNPIYKDQYGADIPYLKGKNIPAIFKNKIVSHQPYSIYRSQGMDVLYEVHGDYIFEQYDVNTALRVADEKINQVVGALKGK